MPGRQLGFIRTVEFGSEADESSRLAPALLEVEKLELDPSITFFVGPTGSGKSTLREAIAVAAGSLFRSDGTRISDRTCIYDPVDER